MLLRHYLYQWEAGALNKDKWGAHRGADYFIIVVFIVLCVVSKECVNVHLSLQRYILKVYDSARLPNKLLQFLNEQNC